MVRIVDIADRARLPWRFLRLAAPPLG